MGRRKPNHYGCVTKLKGNRSRPWVVKVTVYDAEGHGKQVPIDYAETEEQANAFVPPEWFGKDVTSSGEYQNSRLASI